MRRFNIYNDKGHRYRWKTTLDHNSMERVVRGMEYLLPVCVPELLQLQTATFNRQGNYLPDERSLEWIFCSDRAGTAAPSESQIIISDPAIPGKDWVKRIDPAAGHEFQGVLSARIMRGRSRINPVPDQEIQVVDRFGNSVDFLTIQADHSWWISMSDNSVMYPPVSYEVSQAQGFQFFDIYITWQYAWDDPQTSEYEWMKECMIQFDQDKWYPDKRTTDFLRR